MFGLFSFSQVAYADDVTVSIPERSSIPGCEETNSCYIPSRVTIDVGDSVTWSNDDSEAHSVTSGTIRHGPDGSFDSTIMFSGDTFSVSFDNFNP